MKKFLIVFLVLCMVLCFCMPVSAEPGGIYRIEEAGMTVKIPQDWIVMTRNTPPSDENIARHYTDYTGMIEFMMEYDIYIDVYPPAQDTCISLEMWPADELADEMRAMMEAADDASVQNILQAMQADGKFTTFSNVKFYQSNPGGDNNYRYLQYDGKAEDFTFREYAIIVDSKVMFISSIPLKKDSLGIKDIDDLENFLKATYIDGAKSIVVSEKKGIDVKTILLWVLAGLVIIGAVVIGILLLGKKGKQFGRTAWQGPTSNANMQPETPMQPVQPIQPISPVSSVSAAASAQPASSISSVQPMQTMREYAVPFEQNQPTTPEQSIASQPPIQHFVPPVQSIPPATSMQSESTIQASAEAVLQKATATVCSNCGKDNEKDAVFCVKCGTKLEEKLVCKACGTPLEERDVFCRKCGTKV